MAPGGNGGRWHDAAGEIALIVALAGLNAQIVTQSTYAIVVFMTAVTTILALPALRHLFREEAQ